VELKALGPLHAYDVALVAAPVRVNVPPAQREVAEGVALTDVGAGCMVTADVVTEVVPQLLVAASV
jgi:hypothetical protein